MANRPRQLLEVWDWEVPVRFSESTSIIKLICREKVEQQVAPGHMFEPHKVQKQ